MQRDIPTIDKQTGNSTPSSKGPQTCGPELVTVEVANIQGELVVVHSKPQDGSALEAAAELYKLTGVLDDKAAEIKELADHAFLGQAVPQMEGIPAGTPDAIDSLHLHSDVQEAVDDLRDKISEVQIAVAQPASAKQAADHAEALDKVAEVLETSSGQIKDLKVALTAKELNNMDGFDR
jgi:hypothetical protein